MNGRWLNIAIIFLWIVMMTWLVKEKVLPSLLAGDPPDQRSLVEVAEADPDIGWLIRLGQKPIGWAKSHTERTGNDTIRMTTAVHFDQLPVAGMVPKWLKKLPSWTGLDSEMNIPENSLETDATSEMILSTDGELRKINSSITIVPLKQTVKLTGEVCEDKVELNISADGFSYDTEIALTPDLLMANSLTPQTHLPDLHSGQTWMVGVVSPMSYPFGSMEVMYAKVVGRDSCSFNNQPVQAWLIEYRQEPDMEFTPKNPPRCRLWVHPDGMVLRQELRMFDTTLTFERKPADQVVDLYKELK